MREVRFLLETVLPDPRYAAGVAALLRTPTAPTAMARTTDVRMSRIRLLFGLLRDRLTVFRLRLRSARGSGWGRDFPAPAGADTPEGANVNRLSCPGELHLQRATHSQRSALQRVELDPVVLRIQKPIDLRATRLHARSHLGFRDLRFCHRLFDLPGNHSLLCEKIDLVLESLLLEKAFERGADVRVRHFGPVPISWTVIRLGSLWCVRIPFLC